MQTILTTPMIRQYLEIKEKHKDSILFFRLGDFYEMFFEDAKVASKILNIALTSRNKGKEDSIPLCGIPHHSAQSYIDELVSRGLKVAICEQVEDPKLAKDIVKREVVQIVTPGLLTEGENLRAKSSNYLLALSSRKGRWGLAYLDISTGGFRATEMGSLKEARDEISRVKPKEVLIPEELDPGLYESLKEYLSDSGAVCGNRVPAWTYDDSEEIIKRQYGVVSLEGLGLVPSSPASMACAALIHYAGLTQKSSMNHLSMPYVYSASDYMVLDSSTVRNLGLVEGEEELPGESSLLSVIDKTATSMGGRKIREWLLFPLIDLEEIRKRQDAVEELSKKPDLLQRLTDVLSSMSDLERISTKVSMGRANARDLRSMGDTLSAVPGIKDLTEDFHCGLLKTTCSIDLLEDVAKLIEDSISDNPPVSLKDGGIIKDGFEKRLDELRKIRREGKSFIASLEEKEKKKTGISSLKVGYNGVFGYYIEVTNANLKSVPSDYIRKQTLSNAERYVTPELKEYEEKVLSAEEKIGDIEYGIFQEVRSRVAKETARINKTAGALAVLDALGSLAFVAKENGYSRPLVSDSNRIFIENGRHPVVEKIARQFIPNDLMIDGDARLLIITGPNMAGKSTILRQVALITVLAHMGSFVPASKAEIGLVDRIFTIVGAKDRLVGGYSTFMVEMMETSNILHNATEKSLIVLDEIGRGTSTFDGVSIAWAVAEHIHDGIKAKTLFATHYHELCDLARVKSAVKNYNVAVKEWEGKVIFLRKLVEGPVNRSYGIQVARLAGLPDNVLERAREILRNLESQEYDCVDMPKIAYGKTDNDGEPVSRQMTLFKEFDGFVSKELDSVDLNALTPIEALNLLAQWKKKLK